MDYIVQKCDKCSHSHVCGIMKDKVKLDAKLADEQRLMENQCFVIKADCKYYQKDIGNTRQCVEKE